MPGALDPHIERRLRGIERRFEELSGALADPALVSDQPKYRETTKAYAELSPVAEAWRTFGKVEADLAGARELLSAAEDAEMRAMAADEVRTLEETIARLRDDLKVLLLPSDPNDAKNVVLALEGRHPALVGIADGPAGKLPAQQTGLSCRASTSRLLPLRETPTGRERFCACGSSLGYRATLPSRSLAAPLSLPRPRSTFAVRRPAHLCPLPEVGLPFR